VCFFILELPSLVRGKNDFAEESKILLFGCGSENNLVGILKIMSNIAKNFDILTTNVQTFYIIILVVQ